MKTSTWVKPATAGLAGFAHVGRSRARRARREAAEEYHTPSLTALAADTARRGTSGTTRPARRRDMDSQLQVGDPDVDAMETAFVGDEVPGGDMPTPDQDGVDDIGRAYGVAEADSGELRTAAEILEGRDRRRHS